MVPFSLPKAVMIFSSVCSVAAQPFSFDFGYDSCLEVLLSPDEFSGGSCMENWEIVKPLVKPTQKDIGWAYTGSM
jgi:hypothetical protein